MMGSVSWVWMATRSAALTALASISATLIEDRCMPFSIQSAKKIGSMELVPHMAMSAPPMASSA